MTMATSTKTLRELRNAQGLTIAQLEARTHHRVSASTIGRIERGAVIPERRTREDLAIALGVRLEDIAWPETVTEETSE